MQMSYRTHDPFLTFATCQSTKEEEKKSLDDYHLMKDDVQDLFITNNTCFTVSTSDT
jgi:hypothetical protein